MYRRFGGSALILVFFSAMVSGVAGLGSDNPRSKVKILESKGSTPAKEQESSPIDDDTHRCAVVEILRRHYGGSDQPPKPAKEGENKELICSAAAFSGVRLTQLDKETILASRVIIATVPDPLQSADSLEFDRDIEALQEAAFASGYDFESIFTEWKLTDLEEPKAVKEAHAAEHYRRVFGDEPGAMLFHGRPAGPLGTKIQQRDDFLLMILVPESSTYGLNMHAAEEALASIAQLKAIRFLTPLPTDCDEIRWIGPQYSASAYGLERLSEKTDHPFYAYSGSITSGDAIERLRKVNNKDSAVRNVLPDDDVSALESDAAALHRLLDPIVERDLHLDKIAILQEDESAYGGSDLSATKAKVFRFPRGISHIRRVFGNRLLNFVPGTDSSKTKDEKSSTFDFEDAIQQPLDTAPQFAAQSPYSNEGVLSAIAAGMLNEQIDTVIILATDPLDELFLARYYQRKMPNARLILLNSEHLILDLRNQYDLDGVLTLNRFPLFDGAYLETPWENRRSLTFMDSTQEGIFFAGLHQIAFYPLLESHSFAATEIWNSDTSASAPLLKPSTWLSIASHGSFWPVRRLDDSASLKYPRDKTVSYIVTELPLQSLPRIWVIADWLVSVSAFIHISLYLIARPLNSWFANSSHRWMKALAMHRFLTFYLNSESQSGPAQITGREYGRRYWLFSATMQLNLIMSYLLLPAAFLLDRQALGSWGIIYALVVGFLYILVVVILILLAIDGVRFQPSLIQSKQRQHRRSVLCLITGSLILMLLTLIIFLERLTNSNAGTAFAIRCVHLTSGVSPVLPLIFVSLGFIVASAVNLNALTLARDRNPQMPKIRLDVLRLGPCEEQLRSYIECWGLLPNPKNVILTLSVTAICCLVNPWQLFASVDGRAISMIFGFNVLFGLWTIGWLWMRFISIWNLLRFLLEALEGSQLRFAFSRLPKVFSLEPIWSYAGLRRTLILPMRWFEYFGVMPSRTGHKGHHDREQVLLNSIAGRLFDSQVLIEGDYVKFSSDQNLYASKLAKSVRGVPKSWSLGGLDAQVDECVAKEDASSGLAHSGIKSRHDPPSPCGQLNKDVCEVALTNEFIAMRFGAYIRYVALQLKNLMSFMSIGLVLFLLATVCYPFRQPEKIAWSMLVIVIVLLIGVGKVLIQMDRDSILSRMSETDIGKINRGAFIWHMLTVGGLPTLTALSAIFPAVGNFLSSWIQPFTNSLR